MLAYYASNAEYSEQAHVEVRTPSEERTQANQRSYSELPIQQKTSDCVHMWVFTSDLYVYILTTNAK